MGHPRRAANPRVFLLGCLLIVACSISAARGHLAPELIKRLEAQYSAGKPLRAVFEERYYENGRLQRTESGTVYFQRAGKMRWEYESPESKLFLSDGHTLWFYVPGERTAFRSSVKESADWRTPFSLLTRNPQLSRVCKSVEAGKLEEAAVLGNEVLHCVPRQSREESQEDVEILIEIGPETGELSRVKIAQRGGTALEFYFSRWTKGKKLEDARFRFAPPAGVAIVERPAGDAALGGDEPR